MTETNFTDVVFNDSYILGIRKKFSILATNFKLAKSFSIHDGDKLNSI